MVINCILSEEVRNQSTSAESTPVDYPQSFAVYFSSALTANNSVITALHQEVTLLLYTFNKR
jgi:hypothetical protein